MARRADRWLTTGQAAALCAVKPDTVLKWIKKGRLAATRTAGGHYRVDRQELDPLIAKSRVTADLSPMQLNTAEAPLRCWEYLGNQGLVSEECRGCVVYAVRAARCFLMADMDADVGHTREFCHDTCDECVYYRWVKGLLTNVLVITPDEDLVDRILGAESKSITLRVARSAYEASAIVQSFQAAFVIIDAELLAAGERELPDCLASDPRLPGVRILLAVPARASDDELHRIADEAGWSVIRKPFELAQLASVISETEVLARRSRHARSGI